MSTAEPCLMYFKGRGLGEICRLMMAAAGIQFRDEYYSEREDFLKMVANGTLLYWQLPVLKIDGLQLAQSHTIARYVARKGGLYGANDRDAAFIDMYFDGARDFMNQFNEIGFLDQKSTLEGIKKKELRKYQPIFEKILRDNNTGFLYSNKLTMADISLLEPLLSTVEYFGLESLNDFQNLQKFYRDMTSMDRISTYLRGPQRNPVNDDNYIATVKRVLGWD